MKKWRFVLQASPSQGVPRRSLTVALIVGTILNLINQGDVLLSDGPVSWWKALLTYCVRYAVATYGAVSMRASMARAAARAPASRDGCRRP